MTKCPACKKEVEEWRKRCPHCGAEFENDGGESGGAKFFKILAWVRWICGVICAFIYGPMLDSVGAFFCFIIGAGISGGVLYAQAELFNYLKGTYLVLSDVQETVNEMRKDKLKEMLKNK